jgi:hypothetical protein
MAKSKQVNDDIREIFQKSIGDGYKKNHVCALTLGSQCVPQFDGFLRGRDFGIKPLERVLSAFDYEIHVVAIPKNDKKVRAQIDSLHTECIDNITQVLISSLDTEAFKTTSGRTSPLFKESADEILKQIGLKPADD